MGKALERRTFPLIDLARTTYAAFSADGGRALSAALVYYSTLSIVPLAVMVIALPGLLLRLISYQAGDRLMDGLVMLFGPEIGDILARAVDRVQSQSLLVAGVSLAMLLYSSSSVFRFLRYAFHRIWHDEVREHGEPRLRALRKTVLGRTLDYLIGFAMVLTAPMVGAAGLLIYGLALFARMLLTDLPLIGDALGSLVTPLVILAIYAGIFILLLWAMPPVRLGWGVIWPPGLLCGCAVLVTTYGLGLYIRFFSASNLYGAVGTLFALQIWAYANAVALFFCAELCKLLARGR